MVQQTQIHTDTHLYGGRVLLNGGHHRPLTQKLAQPLAAEYHSNAVCEILNILFDVEKQRGLQRRSDDRGNGSW